MSEIRDRCVALCMSLRDVGMTDAPKRYLDLIAGAGESPALRADMGRMSGCALVVRGIWRELGVAHPILASPYRPQRAMADLIKIAIDGGALVSARRWATTVACPGDVLIVGEGVSEHAWTITKARVQDWPGAGDLIADGLDGGQRDSKGRQVIRELDHEIVGVLPRDERGRTVHWLIDLDALWSRLGAA